MKFATPQSEARTLCPGLTFFQRLSHQPARFLHPRRSLFPFGACALRDSASTQVHLPSGGRWAHPWPKKIASPFTAKSLFSSVSATASWSCWSQRSAAAGAAERCAAGPRAASLIVPTARPSPVSPSSANACAAADACQHRRAPRKRPEEPWLRLGWARACSSHPSTNPATNLFIRAASPAGDSSTST